MAEKKAGIIVILSSPSGAGKTTLVKKISSRNTKKNLNFIGIDLEEEMCSVARKKFAYEKDNSINFYAEDFLDFQIENKISINNNFKRKNL